MIKRDFLRYFLLSAIIFSPSMFFHSRQVFLLYPVEVYLYIFVLNFLELNYRRVFIFSTLFFVAFSAIFTSYGLITGLHIGYQILASTVETNFNEAVEFMHTAFFIKFVLIYLFIMIVSILLIMTRKNSSYKIYKNKVALYLLIPVFLVLAFHRYKEFNYYPQKVVVMFYTYFSSIHDVIDRYKSQKYSFKGRVDNSNKTNFILVIGEASRKASYSLYGYKKDTNPLLSKDKSYMILFDNAQTVSRATRVSVPSLLSTAPIKLFDKMSDYPTLIRILNSVGFATATLSNQTINMKYDTLISVLLQESKNSIFLQRNNNHYFDRLIYDDELLPYAKKIINSHHDRRKFIVIHLEGSHYKYDSRYPKEMSFFKEDTNIARYDNSIRMTDKILYNLKEYIKDQKEPYALLYVADHGEYLNEFGDELYGHGIKEELTKVEIEIPFIFIYNKSFEKRYHDTIEELKKHMHSNISLDNVSHTVLGILGVFPASYDKSYDLSSKEYKVSEKYFTSYSLKKSVKFKELKFRKK